MNAINYSGFVMALFAKRHEGADGLMHAAIGIAGEAGELLDSIKKHWVYGKPIDRQNIIEELGDLEFYMMALREQLGVDREQIVNANITKLLKRYPNGYTDESAIARADKRDAKAC